MVGLDPSAHALGSGSGRVGRIPVTPHLLNSNIGANRLQA
jgi:hypothetical protein